MKLVPDDQWIWMAIPALAALLLAGCNQGGSAVDAAPNSEPAAEHRAMEQAGATEVPAPDRAVIVPEGTILRARLIPTLSTKTHSVGDTFEATLAEPLVVDGRTVAPAGADLEGKVVEADKGGRVEGRARIAVQLTSLVADNGQPIEITTDTVAQTARATKKKDATKIGIGAGVGAAIGAIAGGGKGAAIGAAAGGGAGTGAVLATRGEPAVLPSETVLSFRLRHTVTIS